MRVTKILIVIDALGAVPKGCNPIYPTPPLMQNMTQGQFLSGV